MKTSKSIRERSQNFLQQNLIELLDEWHQEANDQQFHVRQNQNSPKNH